ncbi:MAG TPA: endolytic transglycosylase MltG [Arthrobacter sp.]|nr:endolytic transglycosylase MltG [Arthrobacter sp.]
MSPANIDDTSGPTSDGAARQLTRKELRALEKSLHTESNDVVPEQAYETANDYPEAGDWHGTAEGHPPAHAAEAGPAPAAESPATVAPAVPTVPPAAPAPAAAHEPFHGVVPATVPEPAPAPEAAPAVPAVPDTAPSIQHGGPAQPEVRPDEASWHDGLHSAAVHADDHHDDFPLEHEHQHFPAYAAHVAEGHHVDDYDAHQLDGHGHHVADHAPYYDDQHHDEEYHPDAHHHDAGLLGGASAVAVVPRPSKKVRRRRRLLALFLTLAVFVTAVAVGAQFIKPLLGNDKPNDFPGPGTGEVVVSVVPGEGTRSMAAKLENAKVVANADTFLQAFTASGGTLSPGDYTFKTEMKNSDAVNVLLGQDKSKVIYFALSAGLRIGESLQAISEGSGVPVAQLTAFSNSPADFGLPANAKNLEGFLAPGEYRFPLGTPAKDILHALVKVTIDELVSQGITDPAKQYEAVIVASIVQAEGGQAEYGDVAGAIYNRLKPNDQTNGYLQVDSAVTYGLGTKSFNFTDEQRQDKANPYNTYANPGLPPGPIGSPGKTAIDAAARPKTNDYLYWVTINLDTKETKFSKTLAEHNVYVDQYNTWCEAHVGRCA